MNGAVSWREPQARLETTHVIGPPLRSLPGPEAVRGQTWKERGAGREAGGGPRGAESARDPAARHVRRRRPWREASHAAEAAPLSRTTATGAG